MNKLINKIYRLPKLQIAIVLLPWFVSNKPLPTLSTIAYRHGYCPHEPLSGFPFEKYNVLCT